MRKFLNRKTWPLILCFLAPIFIMACYFAYRNMSPFGRQSILTVDLGQQYVDLFANFKHVLFSHPSGLFYSFSKAFGGEMLGTWAYYLMSPLNLLLLIIPIKYLPAEILLIILMKYGLSGLSFGYLLSKTIQPNSYLTVMWSVIYALNGWIIANQINLMWLDGMIWLPLVILGLNQLFSSSHTRLFIITFTLAIITNYYMGYMIGLFVIIYLVFKFTTVPLTKTEVITILKKLSGSVTICFGLSAWLILPTWYSLSQGKAHYAIPKFSNQFEYAPFKLVSKLFNGGLNFDQLPSGTPNIFIGSVALISFFIYLFRKDLPTKKRLSVLAVTMFLVFSMNYQPLDLLWHAGQFPVWYPYRFSYIFCFWMIWVAANAINPHYQLSWLKKLIIAILISSLIIYVFINRAQFAFISPLHYLLGVLFLLFAFILLLYTHNDTKLFAISLLLFSIFEMSSNAFNSLNNLSYVSNRSYTQTARKMSLTLKRLKQHDKGNYRIGKTYYRSKNDPFTGHYYGGDVFDSSLESTTPKFMKSIGQPEGRGFVTYSNGTLLSDQLLGYRYFLTTNHYQSVKSVFKRNDLQNYPVIQHKNNLQIHQDSHSLPFIFTTYPSSLKIKATSNPVSNQNRWYYAITHQTQSKFKPTHFNHVKSSNLKLSHGTYQLINPLNSGDLTLRLSPKSHEAYYGLINPHLASKSISAIANGHPLLPNTSYNHSLILNLTSGLHQQPVEIHIRTKQAFKPNDIKLYQLNVPGIFRHHYVAHARIQHFTNDRITGQFTTTPSRTVIGSSIPATKGWHLKIDGKEVPIKALANEFIGAKTRPGKHTFTLTFIPPLLPLGIIITLLTILISTNLLYLSHKK